jgi:hypothetical protein
LTVPEIKDVCNQLQSTFKTSSDAIYIDIYVTVESEGEKKSTLLERWIIKRNPSEKLEIDGNRSYINSCVLMRALFSTVLVLPSYKLYRKCSTHRRGNIQLSFYMDSSEPIGGFSIEEQQKINFNKVESSFGSMSIMVQYRKVVKIEVRETVSKPIQIVNNHFGSKGINKKKDPEQNNQEIMKTLSMGSVGGSGSLEKSQSKRIPSGFKGLIQDTSFSKSPPFAKTYDSNDSPLSQPSSLNSPPFESMMSKQFNSQNSLKKSFKISFSPFIDSGESYHPGNKITESFGSPKLFERLPETPVFSIKRERSDSIIEIPPFLHYELNKQSDDEEDEEKMPTIDLDDVFIF